MPAMGLRTPPVRFLLSVGIGAGLLSPPAAAAMVPTTRVELFNAAAHRRIPMLLYRPGSGRPLAALLPGVGAQLGDYSFLAKYLVARGFAVAEVRLELRGDPPIPTSGNLAKLRAPELQSGVNTLRYAIAQLERLRYATHALPVVLVGHSNGGDIAMSYHPTYRGQVATIFSLDNLHVPIPRTSQPHICSLRSGDKTPDDGVVPDEEQRRRFEIQIQPSSIPHGQMWNGATRAQQRLILNAIGQCLNHRST